VTAPAWRCLRAPCSEGAQAVGDVGWQGALESLARLGISCAVLGELVLLATGLEANSHRVAITVCGWLLLRPLLKPGQPPR